MPGSKWSDDESSSLSARFCPLYSCIRFSLLSEGEDLWNGSFINPSTGVSWMLYYIGAIQSYFEHFALVSISVLWYLNITWYSMAGHSMDYGVGTKMARYDHKDVLFLFFLFSTVVILHLASWYIGEDINRAEIGAAPRWRATDGVGYRTRAFAWRLVQDFLVA